MPAPSIWRIIMEYLLQFPHLDVGNIGRTDDDIQKQQNEGQNASGSRLVT